MARVLSYNKPIMRKNVRLELLIQRYLAGGCTSEQFEELKFLLGNMSEFELDELYDSLPELAHINFTKLSQEKVLRDILEDFRVQSSINNNKSSLVRKILVAASILFLITVSVLLYRNTASHDKVESIDQSVAVITPGYDRAKVVTDDGKTLLLDTLTNEDEIKAYGLERKVDKNGKLYFKYLLSNKNSDNKLHTISTPKGGQLSLELPDGSRVWMNAASTIQFSNAFVNKERRVITDGEVYFEVKEHFNKGVKLPFYVITKGQEIAVLGTIFNVNSYDPHIITTLVEGKVSIEDQSKHAVILMANQQAIWNKKFEVRNVDPLYAVAWKDGDFAFYKSRIEEVMLSISRWYNVDVEFKGNFADDEFTGTISRYEDIDKLLKTMELTGSINLKREGRKIIVQKSIL